MNRPLPVVDLDARLEHGLARGAALLHASERAEVARIRALRGDPALLLARLTARRPEAWRLPDLTAAGVDDVTAAARALVDAGLATHDVPWSARAAAASRPVLAAGCDRLGLARGGRRAELAERLSSHEDWDDAAWLSLSCAPLVTRLERWATFHPWPDRSAEVLERLGSRTWAAYETTGRALVPTRADWDAWEDTVDRWEALEVDEALEALDRPHWPPGRLDLRRDLARAVRASGHALERAGELEAAESVQRALVVRNRGGTKAVRRLARVLEHRGRAQEALAVVRDAHDGSDGAERLDLARAGRRLARSCGRSWAPDPPLRPTPIRTLRLTRTDEAARRPRYVVDGARHTVEDAVATRVRAAGRQVVHGEGRVLGTLAGLLFGEMYWRPVEGQLPVPRLAGPLDLSSPWFAARRADGIQAVLDGVAAGEGPDRIAAGWDRWQGVVLAGVHTDLADRDAWVQLAEGLGPKGLRAWLTPWLRHGRRATAGFPDLVIWPGAVAEVEGLHPRRLPGEVVVVEVKGETDTLRDGQAVWLDRLQASGQAAELWRVV